jgi:hypothetical protein
MPEQREENSVLFSLKELRQMEDNRLQQEESDRVAKVEAERRAREDAERRVRDDQERRVRDEQERVRRAQEEVAARQREEQMRLAEAERRARVDGEMRLQEERMRIELAARKQARSPVGLIAGIVGALVVIGGGVIYKIRSDHQAEVAQAAVAKAEAEAKAKADRDAQERKFKKIIDDMNGQLAAAKTDADRQRIRQEIDRANRERDRDRRNVRPADKGRETTKALPTIKTGPIDDDPLKGLKL